MVLYIAAHRPEIVIYQLEFDVVKAWFMYFNRIFIIKGKI